MDAEALRAEQQLIAEWDARQPTIDILPDTSWQRTSDALLAFESRVLHGCVLQVIVEVGGGGYVATVFQPTGAGIALGGFPTSGRARGYAERRAEAFRQFEGFRCRVVPKRP